MGFWTTLGNIGQSLLSGAPIIGGLIQGNINAKVARENTDKTIAANRQLAEYQYSKDLEMWNRGNVYNSPMAQMDRLKAAGLNPNMVYGSGSAAGMASGALPKYNAPTVQYNYQPPVDIPSMISQFQDFRMRNAQVRNTDAQFEKLQWQNLFAQETSPDRILAELYKQRILGSRSAIEGERGIRAEELAKSQLAFQRAQGRKAELEQNRIIAATKNLDLQNDYFAAKAITDLFGGVVRGVAGVSKTIQGSRAGKAVAPHVLKDARKWQEFDRAQRRMRYGK